VREVIVYFSFSLLGFIIKVNCIGKTEDKVVFSKSFGSKLLISFRRIQRREKSLWLLKYQNLTTRFQRSNFVIRYDTLMASHVPPSHEYILKLWDGVIKIICISTLVVKFICV